LAGARGGVVDGEEAAGEGLADAGDEFDDLHGAKAGGGAGDGAEDGELAGPRGGDFGHVAAEAAGVSGDERGDAGLKSVHGALDHGSAMAHGGVVEGEAFLEEGGGIDDDVGLGDEGFSEVGGDIGGVAFEGDGGVEIAEAAEDGVDARLADVVRGLEKLAVEVGGFEGAAVGEDEAADAGGGKFESDEAAEAADAGDEDGGGFQFALTVFADPGDPHLPLITGAVFGGEVGEGHGES
jgi:hypothetical protein